VGLGGLPSIGAQDMLALIAQINFGTARTISDAGFPGSHRSGRTSSEFGSSGQLMGCIDMSDIGG
jgi:hypothetical protein